MPAPTRRHLVLLAASTLAVLLAVEAVLRILERPPWYAGAEEAQRKAQLEDYPLNREGLRDDEIAAVKPAGEVRILLLGDSFTFGLGVLDRSATFADRLEAGLNARPPDPRASHYDVLNAGLPGSLTARWVEVSETIGLRYRPDLVLAIFFLRDGTNLFVQGDFLDPVRREMETWERRSVLARASALWRFWGRLAAKRRYARAYVAAFEEAYREEGEEAAEWQRARENLLALQERWTARGVAFRLVVFPVLFSLGRDYPFEGICETIVSFANEHGIPVLSLLPALRTHDASELWISPLDPHPNPRCHALVATELEGWLRPALRPRSGPGALSEG